MNPIKGEPWLKCPTCSYDLRGLSENRCPECGATFEPMSLLSRHLLEPSPRYLINKYAWKAILLCLIFFALWIEAPITLKRRVSLLTIAALLGFTGFWLAFLRGLLKQVRDKKARSRIVLIAMAIYIALVSSPFILMYVGP
ncbi:MAG TPA: hypothetical protein VJZ71_10555 [Phycisphaerae bacterium]|nr:hypothetical protein [Phycisphaerae bacterium]